MKITDADYEDHISKLESGYKVTFGEDLSSFLVTGVCFDLLAQKKMEYVRSYLRTWSALELLNLAERMAKRDTLVPPGLVGLVGGVGYAPPVPLGGKDETLAKQGSVASGSGVKAKEKLKLASIEQARAKKGPPKGPTGPSRPLGPKAS